MEKRVSSGKVAITISVPENLVNRLKRFSNTQSPSQIMALTLSALLEGRVQIMSKPVMDTRRNKDTEKKSPKPGYHHG